MNISKKILRAINEGVMNALVDIDDTTPIAKVNTSKLSRIMHINDIINKVLFFLRNPYYIFSSRIEDNSIIISNNKESLKKDIIKITESNNALELYIAFDETCLDTSPYSVLAVTTREVSKLKEYYSISKIHFCVNADNIIWLPTDIDNNPISMLNYIGGTYIILYTNKCLDLDIPFDIIKIKNFKDTTPVQVITNEVLYNINVSTLELYNTAYEYLSSNNCKVIYLSLINNTIYTQFYHLYDPSINDNPFVKTLRFSNTIYEVFNKMQNVSKVETKSRLFKNSITTYEDSVVVLAFNCILNHAYLIPDYAEMQEANKKIFKNAFIAALFRYVYRVYNKTAKQCAIDINNAIKWLISNDLEELNKQWAVEQHKKPSKLLLRIKYITH